MNTPPNNSDSFFENPETLRKGVSINYKRVFARVTSYWYMIVLSIAIALTTAFLINRYGTRIYPVRASIMIRQSQENAGGQFLYNNALSNPFRNYSNELLILKSYPLLQDVVTELNFMVSFHREGNIKISEYFDPDFPVIVRISPTSRVKPYSKSLAFRIKSNELFEVTVLNNRGEPAGKTFTDLHFNDTIEVENYELVVGLNSAMKQEFIGKQYTIKFHDPLTLARSYSSRLRATWAQQGSSVINLEMTGALPAKDIVFLEKFIERYQRYDVNKKSQEATRSIAFLDEQLKEIGDSLKYFENQLESFKRNSIVTNISEEATRLYAKLEQLESQRLQSALQTNYYDYLEKYLKESSSSQVIPPSAVGLQDPVLTGIIQKLIDAQFDMNIIGKTERVNENPLIQAGSEKISELKRNILEGLVSVRATKKMGDRLVEDQIKEVKKSLQNLPDSESALANIQRNYDIRENLYTFLLQKRAEAAISLASTTSDIFVINEPLFLGAISPKPFTNYLVALLVGLLFPLLIFVVLEYVDNKIQSKDDIEAMTVIPVIGGVGHNPTSDNLAVFHKPRSALAESFRALRSNLNYFTEGKTKKVFLITSSISGEGKSFTSINLATVFSMANKRTLIIAADLRKPRIYNDFKLNNDIGLSQYLSGMVEWETIIQKTTVENLDFVTGGPVPPNPSELLMNERMKACVKKALDAYDFIIIDTPPIGIVTDAFALTGFVDHIVFIVRQGYTPRAVITHVDRHFKEGKLKNISILFNDIRVQAPGYGAGYGYAYSYYYGGKNGKKGYGYYEG